MVKLTELLLNEGPVRYPSDHQPGMKVPKGGSMCANCEYHQDEGNICKNKYWVQWHDNVEEIPYPANEYCCNWWESK